MLTAVTSVEKDNISMKRIFLFAIVTAIATMSLTGCAGNHAPKDPITTYQRVSALDVGKSAG